MMETSTERKEHASVEAAGGEGRPGRHSLWSGRGVGAQKAEERWVKSW